MPARSRAEVVDPAQLLQLLSDPEWREAPLTEGANPAVIVDVSDARELSRLAGAEPGPGRVLIGSTSEPPAGPAPPLLDVALCSDSGAGAAGWVAVPDLAAAVEELADACEATPLAATVLAHVARLNEGRPLLDGLAVESGAYSMLLAGAEFKAWRRSLPPGPARPSIEPVLVEWADEAVTITLNRPEVRNAYDPGMRDALVDALRAAASHPGPIEVVLTGAGPDFCSGGDLSWFGAAADPVLAHAVRLARSPGPLLAHLPATARLHGACIGAGIEVPAFCTRVEATPDTWLQLPEVSMGLIPGAGGTTSIQSRAGRHRLVWMALSGRRIDAAQALDWGLVDALV